MHTLIFSVICRGVWLRRQGTHAFGCSSVSGHSSYESGTAGGLRPTMFGRSYSSYWFDCICSGVMWWWKSWRQEVLLSSVFRRKQKTINIQSVSQQKGLLWFAFHCVLRCLHAMLLSEAGSNLLALISLPKLQIRLKNSNRYCNHCVVRRSVNLFKTHLEKALILHSFLSCRIQIVVLLFVESGFILEY